MSKLNIPFEEEKDIALRTSDIKANYLEKKTSKITPEQDYSSNTSVTRKKPPISSASPVSLDHYKEKDPAVKTTSDVLILGGSGAGKSLLLRRLKDIEGEIEADTLPTVGTDIDTISINKKNILFRELGFKLVHSWVKFCRETKAILFMVDLADYSSISASVIEFYNILLAIEDMPIPVILVLNKIDRPDHLGIDTVLKLFEYIELSEVRENLYLYVVSAASGANIKVLADLLDSLINPNDKNKGKKKKKCCFVD